jgi:branched-chain amino acid aminotransferase
MEFDVNNWKTAPEVKKRMNDVRYGKAADTNNWMVKI